MSFIVMKIYKQEDKQIGFKAKLDNGKEFNIKISQFEGLSRKIPCRNAVYVHSNGGYLRGKNCTLPVEIVKNESPKKVEAPNTTDKTKVEFIKPWEMDMTSIFSDVLVTLSETQLKDYLCIRGGVALSLYLADKPHISRATIDMDIDFKLWRTWEMFVEKCENILTNGSKSGFIYKVINRKNSKNIDGTDVLTLSCRFGDSAPVKFHIDMNVRGIDEAVVTTEGLHIASVYTILCDKISVLITNKVLERVKDLYDIYAISFIGNIKMLRLLSTWNRDYSNIDIDNVFTFNADNHNEIQKTYARMRRFAGKAEFKDVMSRVVKFSLEVYSNIKRKVQTSELIWDEEKCVWM